MTRIIHVLGLALALVLVAASAMASAHARREGSSAAAPGPVLTVRRFALVVGANDGGSDRVVLRYAGSDANAMSSVLQRFGGVELADHQSLSDPTPEEIEHAFERMAEQIRAAKRGGHHIQFMFYYSGHSDEEGLLLGGRRVTYKDLRRQINGVPADVRIAVLDSCASGAFTRTKGGTKRAPFMVSAGAEVKGHAFLTSSSVDEAAQESDRVGGSFFTHYFTTGLRGAADVDGDRLITLSEAYQFAFDETLARTEATRGGAQHAAYDIQLAGSGDLVMTDLRETSARLELAAAVGGRISIRNAAGDLAAELYKPPGSGAVILALEPGRYQITVDDGQDLLRAELSVTEGSNTVLERETLRAVTPEATVERGEARPTAPAEEILSIPFNIGVLPPFSVNGQRGRGQKIVNTVSMTMAWSRAHRLDGVAGAIGATVIDERMTGAQLAVGGNLAGQAEGVQLANVFNHADRVLGVQAATVNHATIVEPGLQAGVVNVVGRMRGVQLGIVNVGGDVKGAQIGLLNLSRRADAGLGLISITKEGGVHPELSVSDTAALNLGLRMPATHTYSFVEIGVQPAGRGAGWLAGLGFGGRVPLPHQLFIDLDLGGYLVFQGLSSARSSNPMMKVRMTFGWQPYDHLSVYGGPTFNLLAERNSAGRFDRTGVYQFAALDYTNAEGGVRVRGWPGFVAGLRF